MMIKSLARGTGSAAGAADYLTREPLPAHDQDQDRDVGDLPDPLQVLVFLRVRKCFFLWINRPWQSARVAPRSPAWTGQSAWTRGRCQNRSRSR